MAKLNLRIAQAVRRAMAARGIGSVADLADAVGVKPGTLARYVPKEGGEPAREWGAEMLERFEDAGIPLVTILGEAEGRPPLSERGHRIGEMADAGRYLDVAALAIALQKADGD